MQRRELLKASLLFLAAGASASVARALHAGAHAHGHHHRGETDDLTIPTNPIFSQEQRHSIILLSDMIIPPTDTPGAAEAGVPGFIETIVGDWYTDTERHIFLAGLDELDTFCRQQGNAPFHQATEEARMAALRASEELANAYTPPVPSGGLAAMGRFVDEHSPFFKKLKELVVLGYYTSEIGATRELAYNPVPGYFDGNYPLEKIGRHWVY